MTQPVDGLQWISTYLEWTEVEPGRARPSVFPGAEAGADGSEKIAAAYLEWIDAAAPPALVAAPDPAALREDILLMALRTESECMHVLCQALSALRIDDRPGARIPWEGDGCQDWPGALAHIEADARALSGRILELRAH